MKTSDMLNVFEQSFPMHTEHSDAQLCYIGCSPTALLTKDRHMPVRRLQVSTIFLRFFLNQISCTNFWLDGMFQASAQTLFDIRFRPNFLKCYSEFPLYNLTFVTIYCCTAVQTLCKINEQEFYWFGRNWFSIRQVARCSI